MTHERPSFGSGFDASTKSGGDDVGHFMAQLHLEDDAARRLGEADWADHFESVVVTQAQLRELDDIGILDALQRIADGLVGSFEEALFQDPQALVALCRGSQTRATAPTRHLLEEVADLAERAAGRGVPVLLSLSG